MTMPSEPAACACHAHGKAAPSTHRAPRILLGVTGSIAAFKACHLASDWTKSGAQVRAILTRGGARFVTPLTFEALTHLKPRVDVFPEGGEPLDAFGEPSDGDATGAHGRLSGIAHIEDAKWADLFVVAPASADVIARLAAGMADDALTTTFLAATCPKLVVPAMNSHMFENPATQRNIATLRSFGVRVLDPSEGELACGVTGRGRMPEPAQIEAVVARMLGDARSDGASEARPLAGVRVLVTAGPTREALDPVRFLSNRSTGKMGYAVAEAARDMGAAVTLVSGPTALAAPAGVEFVPVESARDMFDAVRAHADATDMFVMAAAVGDFRAAEVAPEKIKKNGRDHIVMTFEANPDILAWLGGHKRADQAICGFAMETTDLVANAGKKLTGKHADMLVANNLRTPGAGFATDTNVVTVLTLDGAAMDGTADGTPSEDGEPAVRAEQLPKMGKRELGGIILERLAAIRAAKTHEAKREA